ncbi:MAG: hypothetical protein ACRD2I_01560, partial [Vicinamibacterales bacterium]
ERTSAPAPIRGSLEQDESWLNRVTGAMRRTEMFAPRVACPPRSGGLAAADAIGSLLEPFQSGILPASSGLD